MPLMLATSVPPAVLPAKLMSAAVKVAPLIASLKATVTCVRFVTGASISDPVGFAYDPTRPPSGPFNRHLVGNWYAEEW